MKIIRNVILIVVSMLLAYYFCISFGELYIKILHESAGSFIDGTSLIGIPLAYIFFLVLLFSAFGDQKKFWWITFALIPAVLFETYFDFIHIYFPVAVGLVGWLIGKGIELIISKKKWQGI